MKYHGYHGGRGFFAAMPDCTGRCFRHADGQQKHLSEQQKDRIHSKQGTVFVRFGQIIALR